MTSKNHYVISGRSFIVLLIPFLVLKPFKNEIKGFSAFISGEREERTVSPGLPPMEESSKAGTVTEACDGNTLGSLARCPWKSGVCGGDQDLSLPSQK